MPGILQKQKVAVIGISDVSGKTGTVNTGNMMHGAAARNLLYDYVNMPIRPWSEQEVEQISAECSHIVVVTANAVRPGAPDQHRFADSQQKIAENILRTDLPVVVFGLGVQHKLGKLPEKTLPKATKLMLKVFSERSKQIAVRGHFTAEYLHSIGIKNVRVLGCQSCFYDVLPSFTAPEVRKNSENIAFNYTAPNREKNSISMAVRNGFTMFGQGEAAEVELLNGNPQLFNKSLKLRKFFWRTKLTKEEYIDWLQNRFHRFYDMPSWFEKIKQYDFSFGTRFHGNMVALQSGVPALWIVHDTRTMELCDYHALPYLMLEDVEKMTDISQLLEATDYALFEKAYGENYARLYSYVDDSGIAHTMPAPESWLGNP